MDSIISTKIKFMHQKVTCIPYSVSMLKNEVNQHLKNLICYLFIPWLVFSIYQVLDGGKYEHSIYSDTLQVTPLSVKVNDEIESGDALTVRYKGFENLSEVRISDILAESSLDDVKTINTAANYVEPGEEFKRNIYHKRFFL